jgi:hypothetical protein
MVGRGKIQPNEKVSVEEWEKAILKAACVQAAAILLSGSRGASAPLAFPSAGMAARPDTAACQRYARDLFGKITGQSWD